MKVYSENKMYRKHSRRSFVKSLGFFAALYLVPFSSCKRLFYSDEPKPENYNLSFKEKEILSAAQFHLFPPGDDGPGANEFNALGHFEFILSDKHLSNWEKKLRINGIKWVHETAQDMFNKNFTGLNVDEKELVLRDLATYKNGERWLTRVLNGILESLLGAPAYKINPDGIGWKWLGHQEGNPQPAPDKIYGTYGYGL